MDKRVGITTEPPRGSIERRRNSIAQQDDSTVENADVAAPFIWDLPSRQQLPAQAPDKDNQRWQNILRKYYQELAKGGIKKSTIDKVLWNINNPAELLDQISNFETPEDRAAWEGWLGRLDSVLRKLNDFTTPVACVLGLNSEVSIITWGSIKLILKFALSLIPEAIDILEELCQTLPQHNEHEQSGTWTKALAEPLSDIYTEILVFLARAIVYFHNNPASGLRLEIRPEFSSEVVRTIASLRKLSQRVKKEASMGSETHGVHPAETVAVARNEPKTIIVNDDIKLPCHMIPHGHNPQFIYRAEEISEIGNALEPRACKDGSRTVAIYGLGGVGKTQLALRYANASILFYDIILWVPAETRETMDQALFGFLKRLGLPLGEDAEDNNQVAQTVKDWLDTAGHRFLLIFDNVDNIDILLPLWPASKNGSIILTTRCPSAALKRATKAIHLKSFTQESTVEALYSFTDMKPIGQNEVSSAESICRLLGGLPLAIAQISEFIADRGCSYEEFLSLYWGSPSKVHARGDIVGYGHTLGTVWDSSLQKLPENSRVLQALLCFFEPDMVSERLLTKPKIARKMEDIRFLTDDFAFGDAVGALTRSSLISRSPTTKSISTHRLVQATVFSRLQGDQVTHFFDDAIKLLCSGFPNTFQGFGQHQGHGWASWKQCSEVLPHVYWLLSLSEKHKLEPSEPKLFAELIFRAGKYLWEKDQPTAANRLFTFGFSLGVDLDATVCYFALRILGHIALDMASPKEALEAYQTLESKLRITGDPPFTAEVYDSIACSYTEMGDVAKAFEYLEKATKIHEANDSQRMARTYAIYAVTHLRAGNLDQALDALKNCWSLQELTEEEVAESEYPKHSGDIVLLSRIQYAQGKKEYALHLAKKSIYIRRKILGDKSPRVADSIYLVARMLTGDGKSASAMRLLREIVEMSQGEVEMRRHLARALWTLGELEEGIGNPDEAEVLRGRARELKNNILDKACPEDEEDGAFKGLVGYMLW